MTTDWFGWHDPYADPSSELSLRLEVVRRTIRGLLPDPLTDVFTVVSLCAGQGDDISGALAGDPRVGLIRGRLVELDGQNVRRLRDSVRAAGLTQLEVVQADAADPTVYEGAVPADLVLLCGVFGNISAADVRRTIAAMPAFCKTGGTVVWTRSRRAPDRTASIRRDFERAGFTTTSFVAPQDMLFSVGTARFDGQTQRLRTRRLFTFTR